MRAPRVDRGVGNTQRGVFMHKAIFFGALASLLIASPSFAADGLDYNYIEGGYVNTSFDRDSTFGIDVDGDGVALQGAFAITPKLHAYGEYTNQDFDFDLHVQTFETGLGLNWSVAPNVDLIGRAGFARSEVRHFGHDNGFALQAGVRAGLGARFELEGLVHYVDLDDSGDDTTFRGLGRYSFTDNFSVSAGAELDSDVTTWIVSARYSF